MACRRLSEDEKMSEWQLIETASGITPLMGWSRSEGAYRMLKSRHSKGWLLDGTDLDNARDMTGDFIRVYPTHWMPLPPPPTIK
jgi:hypothetical protein